MAERKGLAVTALALGIVGLFTAGGLVVGSLVGLVLAGAVLADRSRAGRDVAWAALAANVLALLTILPVSAAVYAYWRSSQGLAGDDSLPEPVGWYGTTHAFGAEAPPRTLATTAPRPHATATPRARPQSAARVESAAGPVAAAPVAAAPVATTPLRIGGSIPEPRKLRHVNPAYPEAARAARVQGMVVLECTISPEGKVVATKALRSVPLLTEAAIEAVKQWEYTPTRLDGVAVPVIMTVTVNFKLS
jgi:TonB family protein